MDVSGFIAIATLALLGLRWCASTALQILNDRHVIAHQHAIPEAVAGIMDPPTYARSIQYTLARSRFGFWEDCWSLAILLIVLFSGVLPFTYHTANEQVGSGPAALALWIIVVATLLSLPSLPFDWWRQFRLEQRFGFNTSTFKTWITDQIKGALIGLALGFPLLWLILKCVHWLGHSWWWGAWIVLVLFQIVAIALAPTLILPLFNKFTPLPEGSLRDRLLKLGERTGFNAKTILVADGSRRSRHANAYFTGFGRFRKIVLFDTLIQQMSEAEIEAVLAHEIGHFQHRHIPKMLFLNMAVSFAALAGLGWLSQQPEVFRAFGFPPDAGVGPALLLFGLVGGAITFWLSPIMNALSRRYEYQADRYARDAVGTPEPLRMALRKLSEKNLTNLTPHPLYSTFHYSHPGLVEREAALLKPAST